MTFEDFFYPFTKDSLPMDQGFAIVGYLIALKVGLLGNMVKASLFSVFLYFIHNENYRSHLVNYLTCVLVFAILPQLILQAIACICSAIFL